MTPETLPSWPDVAPDLIAVATGRQPAETVIRGGRVVLVQTREVLDWQIAIIQGRFAYVGPDASHCIGPDTEVIEADGRYVIPGLCDAHMHVESGMLTPAEFAAAVIPHGTTTMFADPHEIANVLGLPGVRLMHDEARGLPCSMFMQMPSCAPSAPGLETTGHEIGPDEVAEAMTWPGIVGLGEMMNFPGVIAGDPKMLAEMAATVRAGATIGGHYASPDLGPAFHGYAAGGPADDHEGTCEADAVARVRQGMRAMMRLGSAWYDVKAQITAITERGLDPRGFILCTDDCMAATLVDDGHMNRVYRHAVECGCDPLVALQMCTITTAAHFGLERELGSIAPGRRADLILTSDLRTLPVERVLALGRTVAKDGAMVVECPHLDWPAPARLTVKLAGDLTADRFEVAAPEGAQNVRARVIGVVENQAPTKALSRDLPVRDGLVEPEGDTCHIALVERHRGTGGVTNAFVSGFGYRGRMAMASTVAHDSHHMIVVGTSRADMALAANRLAEVGGGVTFWADGAERALVELPIAGLMSDRPAAEIAARAQDLMAAMRDAGCTLNNAYMQHSLLALVVIPELRISDLGLVDVRDFTLTDLIEAT
ncbi:Adenine deaminase [Jannaschia seosinensis]|uniref:Adenine deaminase n=1 Tax=Jannaschia seosinensis TaxID=313367 RepID=A0A0M7BBZ4_9RHOB|nr:adenine deaminase [Jannaschia seosinensis]CUH39433.1 Adenine deaminase [Jannaschia seosinensis]